MSGRVIDMNTAAGMHEHLSTLPTANLQEIAARPVSHLNALMGATAAAILIGRREPLLAVSPAVTVSRADGMSCSGCVERPATVEIGYGRTSRSTFRLCAGCAATLRESL